MIDVGLQGRLFRGVKRLLGDADVRRLMVFDQMYRLVALITPVLLQMRTECERAAGPVKSCHVGHPVRFEGRDNLRNATALGRLGEACGYAGFKHHNFYPEPIAATLSFLHSGGDGERVLAVDFGGGTLDLCVLSRRAGAKPTDFAVEAVHGIPLGGDHLDQRLFAETLFPLLGRGQRWRRAGVDVAEIETAKLCGRPDIFGVRGERHVRGRVP